jgi:hypothetical protein
MYNILEFNCWALGDDPRGVLLVEVASSKMVAIGALKKAIEEEMEHSFDAKSL